MEVNETSTLTYPVTAQDRLNYLIGLLSSDQQIAIMFRLSAPLDIELLERAFQLTVKLVPILNCSFVEAENPYWESMPGSGQRATLCSFTECSEEDIERRVNEYIAEPGDRMKAPMIQARLFRARKDRLCVKISHLCSDAAGLKEYMELLASIYTHLCRSADPDMIENDFLQTPKRVFEISPSCLLN